MKQALVSGAGGFIGQRLTALLREAGVAVATIGRGGGQLPGHATVAGQWTSRHWRQALSASQPDIVFHLAGAISGTPDEFEQVNVGIARDLFQALRETGARPAVVLAGSAAEYGETVIDGVPVDEALECAPVSLYGKSKFAQTKAGLAFAAETGTRGAWGVACPPGLPAGGQCAGSATGRPHWHARGGWTESSPACAPEGGPASRPGCPNTWPFQHRHGQSAGG